MGKIVVDPIAMGQAYGDVSRAGYLFTLNSTTLFADLFPLFGKKFVDLLIVVMDRENPKGVITSVTLQRVMKMHQSGATAKSYLEEIQLIVA